MAPDTLPALLDYLIRLLPIGGLLATGLCPIPRSRTGLRILTLILAFTCLRDQMTPAGLWALGTEPALRFHPNPWVLLFLGSASIALLALSRRFLAQCWELVVGFKANPVAGITMGILAGCAYPWHCNLAAWRPYGPVKA